MVVQIQPGANQAYAKIDKSVRTQHYYPAIAARLIIKHFLQELFTTNEDWKWVPDEKQTNIFIIDYAGKPSVNQVKPIVAIQRAPINVRDYSVRSRIVYDKTFMSKLLVKVLNIPMVVHCVSKEELEAESIACAVFHGLIAFQEEIVSMGVKGIRGISLGIPAPAEGFYTGAKIEAFTCPVSFGVVMDSFWMKSKLNAKDIREILTKHNLNVEALNVPPNTFHDINVWQL